MDRLDAMEEKTVQWARDGQTRRHVWIVGSRARAAYTLGYRPWLREPATGTRWWAGQAGATCNAYAAMTRTELARLIRACRRKGYRTVRRAA